MNTLWHERLSATRIRAPEIYLLSAMILLALALEAVAAPLLQRDMDMGIPLRVAHLQSVRVGDSIQRVWKGFETRSR